MRIGRRHWLVALALATGLHAGLFISVFWQETDADAKSAGVGGIEVALGPAGGAPGSVAAVTAETEADQVRPAEASADPSLEETTAVPPDVATTEAIEPTETAVVEAMETPVETPAEVAEAQPETATPQAVASVETMAAETVEMPNEVPELIPVIETVQESEREPPVPEVPVAVQAAMAETAPPDQIAARPADVPALPKRKPRPPEPAHKLVKPEPAAEPIPVRLSQAVQAAEPIEAQVAAAAPSTPGSGGKSGIQDRLDAGNSASDASAGGLAGRETDYAAVLLAWLERHKEYPRRAQTRRQQGVVLLYLVIDRNGQVLESRIEESSGYRLLDRATLDMLKRASPLPPMPDDLPRERLELVVPVQFSIT